MKRDVLSKPARWRVAAVGAAVLFGLAGCNAALDYVPNGYTLRDGVLHANTPPRPMPVLFCYRTLADVECYARPVPRRQAINS